MEIELNSKNSPIQNKFIELLGKTSRWDQDDAPKIMIRFYRPWTPDSWSLYSYLWSLQSPLLEAPSSHRTMRMSDRVQNSLCGFALLDVFRMLADREASRRGMPRGALFLAPETVRNLQQVCLGVLSVCLSKSPEGDPWCNGHHRLTELPVEQHFGRLRVQSSSAQLTAKSFWVACARKMLQSQIRRGAPSKVPEKEMKPISPDEWYFESEKATRVAIRFAAWCSGFTQDSLYEMYCEWADSGKFKDLWWHRG